MSNMLSVVIPTYGRLDSVKALVDALDQQRGVDLEMIVLDQNPDGRLAFLASSRFPLIRIVLDEPNVSTARNVGFVESRGSHLLFIDDDLRPDPDFCARGIRSLQVLAGQPGTHCLWALVHDEAGAVARITNMRRLYLNKEPGPLREIRSAESNAVFIERDAFQTTGGFDEILFRFARTAEDEEFFLRARRRGIRVWVDTSLTIFHDTHQAGGCELRTDSRRQNRFRCMKAWAYRYRVHRNQRGRLSASDFWRLCRSSFLNSGLIRRTPGESWEEVQLLFQAIAESRRYVAEHLARMVPPEQVDFLAKHLADTERKAFDRVTLAAGTKRG
jgi:GT2 family glycosyltransferase